MRYVQLPLRWLLCLNVGFALLVTMGTRRWLLRAIACLAMLAVLAFVWHRIQPPWWDDSGDVAEMLDHQRTAPATKALTSTYPTASTSTKSSRTRATSLSRAMAVHVSTLPSGDPNQSPSAANVSQPGKLVLKLFNYPAWKVEVNHHPVPTGHAPSHRPDGHSG